MVEGGGSERPAPMFSEKGQCGSEPKRDGDAGAEEEARMR